MSHCLNDLLSSSLKEDASSQPQSEMQPGQGQKQHMVQKVSQLNFLPHWSGSWNTNLTSLIPQTLTGVVPGTLTWQCPTVYSLHNQLPVECRGGTGFDDLRPMTACDGLIVVLNN